MSTRILLALAATLALLAPSLHAELDLKAIDASVKPQDDFFNHANGAWLKPVQIPDDLLGWGSFYELADRTQTNLHALGEGAAAQANAPAGSPARLVGDFYASGMDESTINAAGATPLKPELDRIQRINTPAEILAAIAHLKQIGIHNSFGFYLDVDDKDSDAYLVQLTQGGLGLPDRDYYFNDSEKSQRLRADYVEHIARMFILLGDAPETAHVNAQAVMNLETKLAAASLTRVQLRDPNLSYHKTPVKDLPATTGALDWSAFFKAAGATASFNYINLAHPDFLKAFSEQLAATPAADWRAYLRWHLIHNTATYLSENFVNENFAFYGKILNGVKELKPRWKRVIETIDDNIGDALSQLYVAKYFPPESKARVLKLVADLRAVFRQRIETLDWMDAPTRALALEKLDAFSVKMGYPDTWKDYSALTIDRSAYVLNVLRSSTYEYNRNLARIGQPVDRSEWYMTAPTINAYYNPAENGIVFPAGILQPPFFDPKADDDVNYGAIGTVIGHEMTHGFDDQGRQYDAKGNLAEWWTPASAEAFNKRAAVIIDQFNDYTVLDGTLHVNGDLTQGENIADLGGVKLSYAALQRALEGKPHTAIEGYTPEQRFFLSYANIWREVRRPEYRRNLIITDPHSPAEWRVRGPLSNLEEFFKAYDVPEGAPMRRPEDKRVSIW